MSFETTLAVVVSILSFYCSLVYGQLPAINSSGIHARKMLKTQCQITANQEVPQKTVIVS